MPDISGIAPTLTGQTAHPMYSGQSASDVLNTLNRIHPSLDRPDTLDTQEINYEVEGYDPSTDPQFRTCNLLSCHEMTPFFSLAQAIKGEDDPMSENILSAVKNASGINKNDVSSY